MTTERFEAKADVMGHPGRQTILRRLGPTAMSNADLARQCHMSPGQCHWHLQKLVAAGLVMRVDSGGRKHLYVLRPEPIESQKGSQAVDVAISATLATSTALKSMRNSNPHVDVESATLGVDRVQLEMIQNLRRKISDVLGAPPAGEVVATVDVLVLVTTHDVKKRQEDVGDPPER